MAKSERVEASVAEVFADDAEFVSELARVRDAAHEAARFIKKLRTASRLTQRELAARLGISQPRVSAMEKGIGPEGPTYLMLQRVANACGVSWSLETGLRLPKAAANETSVAKRPRRGTNARMIEEILQAAAPRAVRPAEIRKALQDKGVAMAFTTIRHALGQLEARHAAEQVTDRETWRHRSSRGRPLPLRHDRSR